MQHNYARSVVSTVCLEDAFQLLGVSAPSPHAVSLSPRRSRLCESLYFHYCLTVAHISRGPTICVLLLRVYSDAMFPGNRHAVLYI